MKRVSFSIDEDRAAQITQYAKEHGYASTGDFSRVAVLRIMSMYPSKKNHTAEGQFASPGVPHSAQDRTPEGAGPATDGLDPLPAEV